MISVVLSTHNDSAVLSETLSALVPAAVDGLICEVIVVDHGSTDHTRLMADGFGADVIEAPDVDFAAGLMIGARAARQPWLLIVPADAQLDAGFERELALFIGQADAPAGRLSMVGPTLFATLVHRLRRIVGRVTGKDAVFVRRAVLIKDGHGFHGRGRTDAVLNLNGPIAGLRAIARLAPRAPSRARRIAAGHGALAHR